MYDPVTNLTITPEGKGLRARWTRPLKAVRRLRPIVDGVLWDGNNGRPLLTIAATADTALLPDLADKPHTITIRAVGADKNQTPSDSDPVEYAPSGPVEDPVEAKFIVSVGSTYPVHVSCNYRSLPFPGGVDWKEVSFSTDFGDAGSDNNVMEGHQVNHVYDRPPDNKAQRKWIIVTATHATFKLIFRQAVDCSPESMTTLYVSPAGSDGNSGRTPSFALRTAAMAFRLANASGGALILFQCNGRYEFDGLQFAKNKIGLSSYGDGSPAVLYGTVNGKGKSILGVANESVTDIDVCNITFDSAFPLTEVRHDAGSAGLADEPGPDQYGPPTAFVQRGQRISLRRVTFLNVNDGITSGNGSRHFLHQIAAPQANTVRRSVYYGEACNGTITSFGPIRQCGYENTLRLTQGSKVGIKAEDVNLYKLDMAQVATKYTCRGDEVSCINGKSSIEIRDVKNLSIIRCHLSAIPGIGIAKKMPGPLSLGATFEPLSIDDVVIDSCFLEGVQLQPAANVSGVIVRNCIMDQPSDQEDQCSKLECRRWRPPTRIWFINNTLVTRNRGKSAIVVRGQVGEDCRIQNNWFVYPNGLVIDGVHAPIRIEAKDLVNWTIEGNVFAEATHTSRPSYIASVLLIGETSNFTGYRGAAAAGKTNVQVTIPMSSHYTPPAGAMPAIGVTTASAPLDHLGKVSASGRVGAINP